MLKVFFFLFLFPLRRVFDLRKKRVFPLLIFPPLSFQLDFFLKQQQKSLTPKEKRRWKPKIVSLNQHVIFYLLKNFIHWKKYLPFFSTLSPPIISTRNLYVEKARKKRCDLFNRICLFSPLLFKRVNWPSNDFGRFLIYVGCLKGGRDKSKWSIES